MGYLDHSTNNIILDAVLTDYGRSQLAQGGGKFNIANFALGDDEVDYTIIKKYGRTVGKEKIEKNTPIFEALTNENIALKCPLMGLSTSATLKTIRLPVMELTNSSSNSSKVINLQATSTNTTPTATPTINVRYKGSLANASDLSRDFGKDLLEYTIQVSGRFLTVTGGPTLASSSATDPNRTEIYKYIVAQSNNFSFTLTAKSIDATTLAIYGKRITPTQRQITTYVKLTNELGTSYEFPVTYTALG